MTEPKQPDDHPTPEEAGDRTGERDPVGHAPNGVPEAADAARATGYPTNDRQKTEATAHPEKHKP